MLVRRSSGLRPTSGAGTIVAFPPKDDSPRTVWLELWRFGVIVAAGGPQGTSGAPRFALADDATRGAQELCK
jgi:hypothetical protein